MKASMAVRLFLAIAGVAGILMSLPAGAQAMGPGGGMGPGIGSGFAGQRPPMAREFRFHGMDGSWWNNPRITAALKLTDEQRKEMDGILYAHREKLIDLQANLEKADLAMQPLLNADQPNQAAIEAQIDKVVDARAALEKANADFLLDIRMKLTPDQWKQVKAFRAGGMRRDGMRGPQGRDWGHGGPRPGMRRPDGQFHRPTPPGQAPPQAPQQSAPPAAGSGPQQ